MLKTFPKLEDWHLDALYLLYILSDFGFQSYEKLFVLCVVPILDYSPAECWIYKTFKIKLDSYVTLNFKQIRAISFSAISLWYFTTPNRDRTLYWRNEDRLWNQRTVESVTRFLLECDLYNNIRNNTFHDIFNLIEYTFMNTIAKMNLVMYAHARKLAKFIVRTELPI